MSSSRHNREFVRRALMGCYQHSWIFSRDPSTKNGAILFPQHPHHHFAAGVNAFPEGVATNPDRYSNRTLKMIYTAHAEESAILTAARMRVPTLGAWMYCPWAPCTMCARLIIQSGIAGLTTHKQAHDRTPERWQEDLDRAFGMLREAGVIYQQFDGTIGECKSLIDGEVWEP